jgi:hypothetical protein
LCVLQWLAFVVCPVAGCHVASAATRGAVGREAVPLPLTRFRRDSAAFATFSGVADSIHVVIRDAARWREYWELIHRPIIPPPRVPDVDFKREMVVLAALGRRPSLGYDILIRSASRDSAGIEVQLRRSNPGPGCAMGAAVSQPVDLARIPASTLRVRFTELITTTPCGAR